MKQTDSRMRLMEDLPSIRDLTALGAEVVNTKDAQELLGGMAYVSGEVSRVIDFERGLPGQYRKTSAICSMCP